MNNLATRLFSSLNSTKGWLVENCAGDYADTDITPALNGIFKNFGCASWSASGASIYGNIFKHVFTSVTAGRLGLAFNEPTEEFAAYVTTIFTTSATGTSGFNSNGGLALINSGDEAIFEFPYTIKGIDSFQNSAPTITTATNMVVEFQIDTGSGYGGTWLTFNAANLSALTVDEVAGFKFKIRVRATATNAANILTVVYALTNSNAAAQDVLYPLDLSAITLQAQTTLSGAEIRIYDLDNAPAGSLGTELAGSESNGGSTFAFNAEAANDVWIQILKTGYKEYGQQITVPASDSTINLILEADNNI
jgi:hypothetical protein